MTRVRSAARLVGALVPFVLSGTVHAQASANTGVRPLPDGATWSATPLDGALARAPRTCHVHVETIGSDRVLEDRWAAPGWSLVIVSIAGLSHQVEARVQRGNRTLEVFATVPLTAELGRDALLERLARPYDVPLPAESTLSRRLHTERRNQDQVLMEFGEPALASRTTQRRSRDGSRMEQRSAWHGGTSSVRARVRGRTRVLEGRGERPWTVREVRDGDGRVVREERTGSAVWGYRNPNTMLVYDDEGRLARADGQDIEHSTVDGNAMACTGDGYCRVTDADGRFVGFRYRDEVVGELTRDEHGRPVAARTTEDGEVVRTLAITRDEEGQRTRIVIEGRRRTRISGEWEGGRLVRAVEEELHGEEVAATTTYERRYDELGRLLSSVVTRQEGDDEPTRVRQSVTYDECEGFIDVPLEPGHSTPLEARLELR